MRDLMERYEWEVPFIPMNVKGVEIGMTEFLHNQHDEEYLALWAKKLLKIIKDDNYVAELKDDGSRYLSIAGRFFSRKKSENKKNPETLGLPVEKTANVPHLSVPLSQAGDFMFDGEIHYVGMKSNHVTKIMGAAPEKALARQVVEEDPDYRGLIQYRTFDLLMLDGSLLIDCPWHERRAWLEKLHRGEIVPNAVDFRLIEELQLSEVYYGEQAKRDLIAYAQANKLEGVVFKRKDSLYVPDKRPENHWYRIKGSITADVVVMGYEDGEGKYEGQIGSIVFGQIKDGKLTKCGTCSGMDDQLRKELTTNGDTYKGRVLEVEAMERTEKGMFRHPRFNRWRDDKNASDCVWDAE